MACLQIYQELLSLVTFLRVHSNSKEVLFLFDKIRILTRNYFSYQAKIFLVKQTPIELIRCKISHICR